MCNHEVSALLGSDICVTKVEGGGVGEGNFNNRLGRLFEARSRLNHKPVNKASYVGFERVGFPLMVSIASKGNVAPLAPHESQIET